MQVLEGLNILIFLCLWLSVTLNGCGMVVQLKIGFFRYLWEVCFFYLLWAIKAGCLQVGSQISHLQGGCKNKTQ